MNFDNILFLIVNITKRNRTILAYSLDTVAYMIPKQDDDMFPNFNGANLNNITDYEVV